MKYILALSLLMALPLGLSGLSYQKLENGYFSSIHVLVVDPKQHSILPVRAVGESTRRESVANLAIRHGALAAVNGGFWKLNGDPAGILKINHVWHATPTRPRGAIGWSSNGQDVLVDRLLTNRPLAPSVSESEITVLPASKPPYTSSEKWAQMAHIVGGSPVLVQNGRIVKNFRAEQTGRFLLFNKHPRTAVGLRENGDWVFVVVDARLYGLLGGKTAKKLARLMLELGCVEALNLDGGGSSTMVLEGNVVNTPSGKILEDGKYIESVSDAILILPAETAPLPF